MPKAGREKGTFKRILRLPHSRLTCRGGISREPLRLFKRGTVGSQKCKGCVLCGNWYPGDLAHESVITLKSLKELIPKKSAMLCGDERPANRLLMYNESR